MNPEIGIKLDQTNAENPDIHIYRLNILARPAGEPPFLRGDTNVDGIVDISDAVGLIAFLFLDPSQELKCLDAANSNHDGTCDISDAIFTLTFLFLGGPVPDAPGPYDCGAGPSPILGCKSYPACH